MLIPLLRSFLSIPIFPLRLFHYSHIVPIFLVSVFECNPFSSFPTLSFVADSDGCIDHGETHRYRILP